jgi:hypothetical protein
MSGQARPTVMSSGKPVVVTQAMPDVLTFGTTPGASYTLLW